MTVGKNITNFQTSSVKSQAANDQDGDTRPTPLLDYISPASNSSKLRELHNSSNKPMIRKDPQQQKLEAEDDNGKIQ